MKCPAYMAVNRVALSWKGASEEGPQKWVEGVHPLNIGEAGWTIQAV